MRNVAPPLMLVVWTAVAVPAVWASDNDAAVGKKPDTEITAKVPVRPADSTDETPNQRRIRLGQPIVASFPAPDYGVSEETPNQRRRRLGQTVESSFPSPEYGSLEPTPNQLRNTATATAKMAEPR